MNKRLVMGKEIKVNWATTSTNTVSKVDTSSKCIYWLFKIEIIIRWSYRTSSHIRW